MNVSDVRDVFDYNYWANARVIEAAALLSAEQFVDPSTVTTRSLRGTLVHQLDVEWSWRLRWQGLSDAPEMAEADFPTVATLVDRWREDEREMRAYLDGLDDRDLARSFALDSAPPLPLWHFLLHVVNHGTQQRGDAAVLLTRHGRSPGGLDFADFAWRRAAAASRGRG